MCTECGEEASYTISYPASYAFKYNEANDTYINSNRSVASSTSSMTITIETAGTLAFSYDVSSESNCDKLIVTRNGVELLNKSGTVSKTSYSVTVNIGDVIIFSYTKDGSVDSGSDTATIYNLHLS